MITFNRLILSSLSDCCPVFWRPGASGLLFVVSSEFPPQWIVPLRGFDISHCELILRVAAACFFPAIESVAAWIWGTQLPSFFPPFSFFPQKYPQALFSTYVFVWVGSFLNHSCPVSAALGWEEFWFSGCNRQACLSPPCRWAFVKIILFIYLFWGRAGSSWLHGLFLRFLASRRLLVVVCGLLTVVASLAEHGLWSRFSSCGAWA